MVPSWQRATTLPGRPFGKFLTRLFKERAVPRIPAFASSSTPPQYSASQPPTRRAFLPHFPPLACLLPYFHHPPQTTATMPKWDDKATIDLLTGLYTAVQQQITKEQQRDVVDYMKAKGHDDTHWDAIRCETWSFFFLLSLLFLVPLVGLSRDATSTFSHLFLHFEFRTSS